MNIEHKSNEGLEDYFPFPGLYSQLPCLIIVQIHFLLQQRTLIFLVHATSPLGSWIHGEDIRSAELRLKWGLQLCFFFFLGRVWPAMASTLVLIFDVFSLKLPESHPK